jgi:hypothetical protein
MSRLSSEDRNEKKPATAAGFYFALFIVVVRVGVAQ